MNSIRVLLADDHPLLRAGVRSVLESLPGVEVIAEAKDGVEALDLIAAVRPDVALLDITMPRMSGLDVAERVGRDFPATRVIILSMHVDEGYVRKAVGDGVAGYLLKDTGASELESAVHAVSRGETYLSPVVSSHLVSGHLRLARGEALVANPLTPRQREVLVLIAEGTTTKGIARRLGISVKTVETHRTQLMDRLDIHDVAGLVRYAIRTGLVEADD